MIVLEIIDEVSCFTRVRCTDIARHGHLRRTQHSGPIPGLGAGLPGWSADQCAVVGFWVISWQQTVP